MKLRPVALAGVLLCFVAARLACATISSDGTIDSAFGNLSFDSSSVTAAALQPDGKVVITGPFQKVNGVASRYLARLNVDGTVDSSFHNDSGYGWYYHLLVQPDGKILAWDTYGIDRFNADGSFDASFDITSRLARDGDTSVYEGKVASVFLQSDGKLVIAGDFNSVIGNAADPTVTRYGIVRFNVDGRVDQQFIPDPTPLFQNGGVVTIVGAAQQKTNGNAGKIVFLIGVGPSVAYYVGRLNADGSFDSTFQTPSNGGFGWYVSGLLPNTGLFIQSDDRVLLFGGYVPYSASHQNIVRLSANGALDPEFNAEAFNDYHDLGIIQQVTEQADGKLIAVGRFHSLGNAVAGTIVRMERNGARDLSFDATGAGPAANAIYTALVRNGDGKILVAGSFATCGGAIRNNFAWLNPDGSVDHGLDGLTGAIGSPADIYALATQADGKILVGGFFNAVNGVPHSNLVRLNPDGTPDETFSVQSGAEGSVRVIKVLPDGNILLGGLFRAIDGVARARVAKLSANGTLDPLFNDNVGSYGAVNAIALDGAGNIFIGGDFETTTPPVLDRVAKLHPDGSLDTTFTPAAPSAIVYAIAPPTATGGVVIGGDFSRVGSTTQRRIARLDASTGALDTSFLSASSSGFSSSVRSLLLAPDGKYYVGGFFSSFNGVTRPGLARLNGNGTLDSTFQTSQQLSVTSLALQNDKLWAAGQVRDNSTGIMLPALKRFTSSGAADPLFNADAGPTILPEPFMPSSQRSALAVQSDGKLLFGNFFDHFNGSARGYVVRLTDSQLNFTAVSRNTHGDIGDFDIAVPSAVECRDGGPNGDYRVVLTFPAAIGFTGATIDTGSASVAQASGNGTGSATIDLTSVANAQTLSIRLHDVTTNQSTADVTVPMRVLIGDVNGDGSVNSADSTLARNASGQTANATSFRADVNADGFINSADSTMVRNRSGSSLGSAAFVRRKAE
ncbi:MAG: dockerin type I domain-containing protein [Verrucomicrobiota bacterium]|nr:dockerin type I domain-containing protein [Verrucomicrobiota bacterium]